MNPRLRWRPMRALDLPGVVALAQAEHPALPERPEVFAERLALCTRGCKVLEISGRLSGYLVSHPWVPRDAPDLDTLVGALPSPALVRYVHDLVVAPSHRGFGLAAEAVWQIIDDARVEDAAALSLVALGGTAPFWAKLGFKQAFGAGLSRKIAGYGAGAVFMERRPA
ncbi:MAG: GNAT family N-acetyltransferase [Alsobacter sp.]